MVGIGGRAIWGGVPTLTLRVQQTFKISVPWSLLQKWPRCALFWDEWVGRKFELNFGTLTVVEEGEPFSRSSFFSIYPSRGFMTFLVMAMTSFSHPLLSCTNANIPIQAPHPSRIWSSWWVVEVGWVDQLIQKKNQKTNPPVLSVEGITKRKGSRNLGARAFADLGLFDWYCFRPWTSCSLTAGIWRNSGGKRKETQILSSCLKFLWSIFILFTIYIYIYLQIYMVFYVYIYTCIGRPQPN